MANGESTPHKPDGFDGWDDSIKDELKEGVDIPEIQNGHDHDEKVEARIATALLLGIVAAKALHSWKKHRNKE